MMIDDEDPRTAGSDETAERQAEAPTLDRGLAPPTVDPEITSTHPLDRGLAPPDEEPVDTGE